MTIATALALADLTTVRHEIDLALEQRGISVTNLEAGFDDADRLYCDDKATILAKADHRCISFLARLNQAERALIQARENIVRGQDALLGHEGF